MTEHVSFSSGSFRDPSGFIFERGDSIYRQINRLYSEHYNHLMQSGLYAKLIKRGLLVPHDEVDRDLAVTDEADRVIQPQTIPFISYPYEWCFSQLRDSALATLKIQRIALEYDMVLKDASAYNVQFVDGRPVFIDTLSFEKYVAGKPWIAYRQFCQHFLAPLMLMNYKDIRLGQLLRVYIDGVPLDLASSLLPKRSYLKMGSFMHLHLHAKTQQRYADDVTPASSTRQISKKSLLNIVDSLQSIIRGLRWDSTTTSWANYYEGDSYQEGSFEHKKVGVQRFIEQSGANLVWDLGANTGVFSRLASQAGCFTVAWDIDAGAVEQNYQRIKQEKEIGLLPLMLDLTNPSPAMGWANQERLTIQQRSQADLIMALALVHHLAIGNNTPLSSIAQFFSSLAPWAIVEFVPKSDPKVQKLLATREDIFPLYTPEGFEAAFRTQYAIVATYPIQNSERVLYLMRRV